MVVRSVADLEREARGLRETLERKRAEVPQRHFGVQELISALEGRVAEVLFQCEQLQPREDEPPCVPGGT